MASNLDSPSVANDQNDTNKAPNTNNESIKMPNEHQEKQGLFASIAK